MTQSRPRNWQPDAVTTDRIANGAVTTAKVTVGAITSLLIANDTIVNADINPSAAISDTKLATISAAGKVADSALSTNVAVLNRGIVQSFNAGLTVAGGSAVEAWAFSGSRSGGFASPIAYGENNNTVGSSSPVLRLVGKGGNAIDGVLSVSSLGTGDLAKFGNASTFVSSLTTNGTWTALAFNPTSDRAAKENFTAVNPRDVLDKVAALPLARWNFKAAPGLDHIGPMAQDFHAAFGLNGTR